MEAVLALVPEEQQVQYSAMTGQSRLVLHPAFESRFNLLIPHRFRALHAPYPQPPILNKRFRNKSNTFACFSFGGSPQNSGTTRPKLDAGRCEQ